MLDKAGVSRGPRRRAASVPLGDPTRGASKHNKLGARATVDTLLDFRLQEGDLTLGHREGAMALRAEVAPEARAGAGTCDLCRVYNVCGSTCDAMIGKMLTLWVGL
jgi:hypothetical protein